jgi:Flp pilus assembly protein TadD
MYKISFMACITTISLLLLGLVTGCAPVGAQREHYDRSLQLVDQGVIKLRERHYDEARADFELAAELAPLAAAIDGLGCVALMQGDLDTAEQYFTTAYTMDRTYDHALGNLALVYQLRGERARAIETHDRAVANNPLNARFRNNRVMLLSETVAITEADRKFLHDELLKAKALAPHPLIIQNSELFSE